MNRLRFHSSGRTDAGAVRRLNEDAFLSRPEIGLWVVADGMGGHSHGDEASRMIVDALALVRPPDSGSGFIQEVRSHLDAVHQALQTKARVQGVTIGATTVVLMIYADRFVCLWAGDSRLYLLRNRQLWQITRDHSYVQELIDSGALSPEAAQNHPQANVITRAVGAAQPLDLDMERSAVRDGDIFLLCSDGLTKVVTDGEIANLLDGMPPEQATGGLINLALGRGAPDNVTVVALACAAEDDLDDDRTLPPGRISGAWS